LQKSATVVEFRRCLAAFGDSLTFLRQCGQGFRLTAASGRKQRLSAGAMVNGRRATITSDLTAADDDDDDDDCDEDGVWGCSMTALAT